MGADFLMPSGWTVWTESNVFAAIQFPVRKTGGLKDTVMILEITAAELS
jgi:hypothetical protein